MCFVSPISLGFCFIFFEFSRCVCVLSCDSLCLCSFCIRLVFSGGVFNEV